MPNTKRTRRLSSNPESVWRVIGDPHHMPRWWPRVQRVEAVDERAFTQVLMAGRGKAVRADFRIVESEPPRLLRWRQELEGTPFERILAEAIFGAQLEPADAGTLVTLDAQQSLRGMSRFGALMVKRATRAQLDEALDGLERICT